MCRPHGSAVRSNRWNIRHFASVKSYLKEILTDTRGVTMNNMSPPGHPVLKLTLSKSLAGGLEFRSYNVTVLINGGRLRST